MIEPEQVQNRGVEIVDVHRAVHRQRAEIVAGDEVVPASRRRRPSRW